MRKFVLGDVHGAYRALKQCLEKAVFDYSSDLLIFLGDVSDGWSEVPHCIEEFLKIRNFIFLTGNHDQWFLRYLEYEEKPRIWLVQGGVITVAAYQRQPELKKKHLAFIKDSIPYYLDDKRRLFIHAGFNPDKPIEETDNPDSDYYWSRDLYYASFIGAVQPDTYDEIFIGHTPINHLSEKPIHNYNVWLLDTGAGWGGRLSLMDFENKSIYQSDPVSQLYPGEPGRQGLMGLM